MKKFIKIKVISRVAGITGTLLILLVILELLNLSYIPNIFSSYLNTSLWLPLLTGLFLIIFWMLTAKGFKGVYFFITVLTGVALLIIPLGFLGEYTKKTINK